MSLRICSRDFKPVDVSLVERVVSRARVAEIMSAHHLKTQRHRKVSLETIVWLMICANLFTQMALPEVLDTITNSLSMPVEQRVDPHSGAIAYRRGQLGAKPMVSLFHQVCQPLAVAQTQGAFLDGLRLMSIDGQVWDIADTADNDRVFGRHSASRGEAAFPQVQAVYLSECGTHAIVDAGFWPCHVSEIVGGQRLLRSVGPDMLVLADRLFYSYRFVAKAREKGAHVLIRIKDNLKPKVLKVLPDGSQLVRMYRTGNNGKPIGGHRDLRMITYTFDDPANPGHRQVIRLLTSLLDEKKYPALQLAQAYHERWEIELTADEIQIHQHTTAPTLRSKTPIGVLQELYGLLIAHYVVRAVMHEAALRYNVDPDRLSFSHTLRIICLQAPVFQMLASKKLWNALYEQILEEIVRYQLPERKPRSNQRAVKRKMSKFPCKRQTDQKTKLKSYSEAIRLLAPD
jgi:hypothetical protein